MLKKAHLLDCVGVQLHPSGRAKRDEVAPQVRLVLQLSPPCSWTFLSTLEFFRNLLEKQGVAVRHGLGARREDRPAEDLEDAGLFRRAFSAV